MKGYRLLVEAALAGADMSGLAVEFNRALVAGNLLGPEFGVLARRLAEEARWASFMWMVVAVVAAVVLFVL